MEIIATTDYVTLGEARASKTQNIIISSRKKNKHKKALDTNFVEWFG